MESDVAQNIRQVRERIMAAAKRAGRNPQEITLVGVTKTQSASRVLEAVTAGLTDFGENYVQEGRDKLPLVNSMADSKISWHFIGHLQSNKAKYVVEWYSLVHTVDSLQLAQELDKRTASNNRLLSVLLEVNVSRFDGRPGVLPEQTMELAAKVASLPHLQLEGLMGVPPVTETPDATRPYFQQLRQLWEQLPAENRKTLSMGMSGDFELAIEEGATLVRVGTALFGARPKKTTTIGGGMESANV